MAPICCHWCTTADELTYVSMKFVQNYIRRYLTCFPLYIYLWARHNSNIETPLETWSYSGVWDVIRHSLATSYRIGVGPDQRMWIDVGGVACRPDRLMASMVVWSGRSGTASHWLQLVLPSPSPDSIFRLLAKSMRQAVSSIPTQTISLVSDKPSPIEATIGPWSIFCCRLCS